MGSAGNMRRVPGKLRLCAGVMCFFAHDSAMLLASYIQMMHAVQQWSEHRFLTA